MFGKIGSKRSFPDIACTRIFCYTFLMQTFKKKALFWDVSDIDLEKNKRFVIERILSFGNEGDVEWMRERYGDEVIKEVVRNSRRLDKKSSLFWCGYYHIDSDICTSKPSTSIPSAFSERSHS